MALWRAQTQLWRAWGELPEPDAARARTRRSLSARGGLPEHDASRALTRRSLSAHGELPEPDAARARTRRSLSAHGELPESAHTEGRYGEPPVATAVRSIRGHTRSRGQGSRAHAHMLTQGATARAGATMRRQRVSCREQPISCTSTRRPQASTKYMPRSVVRPCTQALGAGPSAGGDTQPSVTQVSSPCTRDHGGPTSVRALLIRCHAVACTQVAHAPGAPS
jgi:hypothetical protein